MAVVHPNPVSGHAYKLGEHGPVTPGPNFWRRTYEENWAGVLLCAERGHDWVWLGTRYLHGDRCNVWRVTEHMTGLPDWYAQPIEGR